MTERNVKHISRVVITTANARPRRFTGRYGVKNVIQSLLTELSSDDEVEPAYLTLPTHESPAGVEQISLLSKQRLQQYEGKQLRYLGYAVFNFWRRVYKWLADKHERYDIIWFHTPRLLPLVPDELTDKLLITYHNHLLSTVARHYDRPGRRYYKTFGALEKPGIGGTTDTRYTVVNPAVVDEVTACGIPNTHVRYVENGADTETFTPDHDTSGVVNTYNLPTDRPLLLFLGRLKGQKRSELLVERFSDISEALDGHVHLAIAGKGARDDAARQAANDHSLETSNFWATSQRKTKRHCTSLPITTSFHRVTRGLRWRCTRHWHQGRPLSSLVCRVRGSSPRRTVA